ncbi:hypothetical protein [Pseudomonas sp. MWU12-2345]|uniref:hypothetical protein n=1 Tax=Pseudomonas sp. MWU12-2345 TaxID=2928689 RepID=UPI00200C88BE|nr:hypothetical protein [Pseudomonas sp. MWU12-2345]
MPLIQIEQDNPEVVSRARVTITAVETAPSESEASFKYAVAQGWIDALSTEGLISHDLSLTLGGSWKRSAAVGHGPSAGRVGTTYNDQKGLHHGRCSYNRPSFTARSVTHEL